MSFSDPLQTRGKYQHNVEVPYVAGSELAGVVLEAPEDSFFRPGDRVADSVSPGALAERALERSDVRPDGTVLVTGAAGGVGKVVVTVKG